MRYWKHIHSGNAIYTFSLERNSEIFDWNICFWESLQILRYWWVRWPHMVSQYLHCSQVLTLIFSVFHHVYSNAYMITWVPPPSNAWFGHACLAENDIFSCWCDLKYVLKTIYSYWKNCRFTFEFNIHSKKKRQRNAHTPDAYHSSPVDTYKDRNLWN